MEEPHMQYLYEKLKTPARLYIKACPHCGLKYFGKTVQRNIASYSGSGKRWLDHLKENNVKPIHLWNSSWYYDTSIIRFALKFSKINHIVESDEWANLMSEDGMGSFPKLSPDHYKKISDKTKGVSRPWSKTTRKEYNDKIRNGDIINPHTKRWQVTDPQGKVYIVDGLGPFCRERNISFGNLSGSGKTKGYTAICLGHTAKLRTLRCEGEGAAAASRGNS